MANHTARSSSPLVAATDGEPTPGSERRDGERLRARLQVLVKGASDAEPVQMRTLDVSSGGIFVAASSPLSLGTLVKLRRAETLGVDGVGRVVWVRGLGESSRTEPAGMGIKFIKLSDQSKEDIEQLAKSPPEEALDASDEMSAQLDASDEMSAQLDASDAMSVQPQEVPAALLPHKHSPREGTPIPRAADVDASKPSESYPSAELDSSLHAPAADPFQAVVAQMTQAALAAQGRPTDGSAADDGATLPTRSHTMLCAYVESPAPEQPPVASSAAQALRVTPTVRHGALAMAGMCALGVLGWAAWPNASPEPLVRATHAAMAQPPAKATLEPTPKAAPEAPPPAPIGAVTEATPSHAEAPVPLAPATLPHVLHVETDPPGAWVVVAGQRARSPADIELPNYDGKRVGLTVGAYQREEKFVYVMPSDFIAREDAIRANVRLKLKQTGSSGPSAEASAGQGATQEIGAQAAAPAPEKNLQALAAPRAEQAAPAAAVNSAAPAAPDPAPLTK